MKSLVRVLPAAAYTFNMVPIYDPGGQYYRMIGIFSVLACIYVAGLVYAGP